MAAVRRMSDSTSRRDGNVNDKDENWNRIGRLVYAHGCEEDKTAWMLCRGDAAEWRLAAQEMAAERRGGYYPIMSRRKNPWLSDRDNPVEDWKYEVANDDTRLGYLEWVESRRRNPL